MWGIYLFGALAVLGLVATVAGAAPVGIVVLFIGVLGGAAMYLSTAVRQRRREQQQPAPQPDGAGHKVTDYAHEGQKHPG